MTLYVCVWTSKKRIVSLACPLFVRRPSQLSPAFASRTCRRDGMCILCAFALDMKNRVSSHNFVCTGTCVCVCVPTARRFHYCLALLWRQTGPLRTRLDDTGTVATGCPVYSILYSIFILTSLNCQLMIQIVSERDQQTHAKKKKNKSPCCPQLGFSRVRWDCCSALPYPPSFISSGCPSGTGFGSIFLGNL